MRVKFVFDRWLQRDHEPPHLHEPSGEKAIDLGMGNFHSGTTFRGTLALDDGDAAELKKALRDDCHPVFYVIEDDAVTKSEGLQEALLQKRTAQQAYLEVVSERDALAAENEELRDELALKRKLLDSALDRMRWAIKYIKQDRFLVTGKHPLRDDLFLVPASVVFNGMIPILSGIKRPIERVVVEYDLEDFSPKED